jgi:hypothetical protein
MKSSHIKQYLVLLLLTQILAVTDIKLVDSKSQPIDFTLTDDNKLKSETTVVTNLVVNCRITEDTWNIKIGDHETRGLKPSDNGNISNLGKLFALWDDAAATYEFNMDGFTKNMDGCKEVFGFKLTSGKDFNFSKKFSQPNE